MTQINWSKLKPSKDCYNCNVLNNYVCFECESIFVNENYNNYFYNDNNEWQLKLTSNDFKGAGIYDTEYYNLIKLSNKCPEDNKLQVDECWIGDKETFKEIIDNL